MRAVTVIAGSLALVLGMSTNAWGTTTFCPPPHTGTGPPGVQTGDPTKDNSCAVVFGGSGEGSVLKTTSAGPNDSVVSPGQRITVTLSWDRRDFGWTGPGETEDCVEIGNQVSKLSQEHGRAPLGGNDTFSYVVPADTGGQPICDRGVVWGYGSQGGGWNSHWGRFVNGGRGQGRSQSDDSPEKSVVLCYAILNAVAPEAPMALLFPATGLIVGGTAYLVVRRRRIASSSARAA